MYRIKNWVVSLCGIVLPLVLLASCDSFVKVDNPPEVIGDEALNGEDKIDFLITGVKARFAEALTDLTVYTGGLSDEQFFDSDVPTATGAGAQRTNTGRLQITGGTVGFDETGELRFYADNLLSRIEAISFEDQSLETRARYVGNLYGGIARYFYGVYYGLEPEQGGGVIDGGPFIPSDEMFDRAVDKIEDAHDVTNDDYKKRIANTLIARIHVIEGNYDAARQAATGGLEEGDEPLQALYSQEAENEWYDTAGPGRRRFAANMRFREYVEENPAEANRIPLEGIEGLNTDRTYYYQMKYPTPDAPIDFVTWQENALILAEIAISEGEDQTAKQWINKVRSSHDIKPVNGEVDLDLLIEERDKELFAEGHRLYDQRRFDIFHETVIAFSPANRAGDPMGPWRYFPIPETERSSNPNID